MTITTDTRITDEQIKALQDIGFRRWTKYGKDRLYANAEAIGLELDYYKTGNISDAMLDGSRISNCQARKILSAIDGCYIDILTGKVFGSLSGKQYVAEAIERA